MTHTHSSRASLILLLFFGLLAAPAAAVADGEPQAEGAGGPGLEGPSRVQAPVKGRVFGGSKPLAAVTVFAYEVVSNAMKRVVTE